MKLVMLISLLLLYCTALFAFDLQNKSLFYRSSKINLKMSTIDKQYTRSALDYFSSFTSLPLCLEPTSKTTVINDPTAGMSAEEITNYMSNVGGGLCGYPEYVRTGVGLGLNLSLIIFGVLTVGYGEFLSIFCFLL
jgi:hypothetical protein